MRNVQMPNPFRATVAPYVYADAAADSAVLDLLNKMAANEVDIIAFTSSVQVERLFSVAPLELVKSALERTGGHQTRAAQLLGINLTTLHNKLKRLEISPDVRADAPVLHEDSELLQATDVLA